MEFKDFTFVGVTPLLISGSLSPHADNEWCMNIVKIYHLSWRLGWKFIYTEISE